MLFSINIRDTNIQAMLHDPRSAAPYILLEMPSSKWRNIRLLCGIIISTVVDGRDIGNIVKFSYIIFIYFQTPTSYASVNKQHVTIYIGCPTRYRTRHFLIILPLMRILVIIGEFSQKHNLFGTDGIFCNWNYMFRPLLAIFRFLQYWRGVYKCIYRLLFNSVETWRWPGFYNIEEETINAVKTIFTAFIDSSSML